MGLLHNTTVISLLMILTVISLLHDTYRYKFAPDNYYRYKFAHAYGMALMVDRLSMGLIVTHCKH